MNENLSSRASGVSVAVLLLSLAGALLRGAIFAVNHGEPPCVVGFTRILPTTPRWLTCPARSTSGWCWRVPRTVSAPRARALQAVSHWSLRMPGMMSCRFTCVRLMPRPGVPQGRSGGTWLPGEFLAPSSWRRRSSGRTGRTRPERSGGGNKSREYSSTHEKKTQNKQNYKRP